MIMEIGGLVHMICWRADSIALGFAWFGWCCRDSFEDRKAEFAS